MRAVVVNIISALLTVFHAPDAATDARLALIVLSQVLRVGQHSLEELQRHDFHAHGFLGVIGKRRVVFHLVDTSHADVLHHLEVFEVLLAEGHPETSQAYGGIVLHQALQFFMVHEITLARSDIRIGERLMHAQRVGLYPLAVFIVESLLGDFSDIDFGIEVGGKSLVVVAGVAVNDVEGVNLVEVVLGSIGRIDAAHARVEATSEDGAQSGLLEALFVGPLPGILEMRLVARLIVGGVEIVASASQAGLHDCEVLVRQSQVDYQFGLVFSEEFFQLFHIIGIHLCRLDVERITCLVYISHDFVALCLSSAGNHEFGEHVGILRDFECCHGGHATGANHQYFAHLLWF